jgi:hypothetical protein
VADDGHLHPHLRRVEGHEDEDEELAGEVEAGQALELVAEEEEAGERVSEEDDPEEDEEVEQVRGGGADGAGHEGHARLEVEGLEDAEDEEDDCSPRSDTSQALEVDLEELSHNTNIKNVKKHHRRGSSNT